MSFVPSTRLTIRKVASELVRRCRCNATLGAVRPTLALQGFTDNKAIEFTCRKQTGPQIFQRNFSSSSIRKSEKADINDFHESQVENRLIVLGKSATIACLTELFLDIYPDLDALKTVNLVSHVTKQILPLSMELDVSSSRSLSFRRAKMYIEIGKMMAENGKEFTLDQLRNYISKKYSQSEIDTYSKLAHPAPLLKGIALNLGMHLEVRKTGRSRVEVLIDESVVKEVSASTFEKAEYEACLAVIMEKFMNEIEKVTLGANEEVLIREFKGKFDGQRVIELSKATDEDSFGIYLKGGEKATKQTEKFWQFNYVEPIFINKILEGSPADKSGCLQEGDVILAVGEFTLNGLTLKSAVSMINEENDVTLTVKFDPEVKLRAKIKEEFIAMEKSAFKETLRSERWGKWHEAQTEKNPDQYLKIK